MHISIRSILLTIGMSLSFSGAAYADWDDRYYGHHHFHHYAPPPVFLVAPPPPFFIPPQPTVIYVSEPEPVARVVINESYCREYTRLIVVGGRTVQGYGTACRQPDGSWVAIN